MLERCCLECSGLIGSRTIPTPTAFQPLSHLVGKSWFGRFARSLWSFVAGKMKNFLSGSQSWHIFVIFMASKFHQVTCWTIQELPTQPAQALRIANPNLWKSFWGPCWMEGNVKHTPVAPVLGCGANWDFVRHDARRSLCSTGKSSIFHSKLWNVTAGHPTNNYCLRWFCNVGNAINCHLDPFGDGFNRTAAVKMVIWGMVYRMGFTTLVTSIIYCIYIYIYIYIYI